MQPPRIRRERNAQEQITARFTYTSRIEGYQSRAQFYISKVQRISARIHIRERVDRTAGDKPKRRVQNSRRATRSEHEPEPTPRSSNNQNQHRTSKEAKLARQSEPIQRSQRKRKETKHGIGPNCDQGNRGSATRAELIGTSGKGPMIAEKGSSREFYLAALGSCPSDHEAKRPGRCAVAARRWRESRSRSRRRGGQCGPSSSLARSLELPCFFSAFRDFRDFAVQRRKGRKGEGTKMIIEGEREREREVI